MHQSNLALSVTDTVVGHQAGSQVAIFFARKGVCQAGGVVLALDEP